MSKIHEVRSVARGDGKLHSWGADYSLARAEPMLAERATGKNKEWADRYHERWWIEEVDTTGLFEIPAAPPPREAFSTKTRAVETGDGTWGTLHVDVLDRGGRIVAGYDRNYPSLYQTFEPFRQGDRILALVSSDYTATSVMDLATGEVIASEEPDSMGFCPTGFYVPDWWDIHDGSMLPGSMYWNAGHEMPKGDFGFVWGCIWGDDGSWKVQYLDLSRVQEGKILRDERFGYVELASHPKLDPREFIKCSFHGGKRTVTFSVSASFDLDDSLINTTIERIDTPALALRETEANLSLHLKEAREAHLQLLTSLFKVLWGAIENRCTGADLVRFGFDATAEPKLYNYFDDM